MKIRFCAKGDGIVREPGVTELVRTPPHYVGRTLARLSDGRFCYPATEDAAEFDSESDAGRHLAKLVRRDGCLWPADKKTADFCGVPFVPIAFTDGEWVPGKEPKAK